MMSANEQQPGPTVRMKPRSHLAAVVAAALVGGVLGGAGTLAVAAGPGMDGWKQEHRLEWMQRRVRGALDAVGATTIQEDKIHDIIATASADMGSAAGQRREMHRQILELMRAPTIDRAAIEKVRGDQVAAFDLRTKKMLGAVLDAADQLRPDQRSKLADRLEFVMQHHHGMHDGWRGHDGMDGHDGDRGPADRGPGHDEDGDNGPDKG